MRHRGQLHINHGNHGELQSRQITVQQIGTSYLWIGSTGKLIPILSPGDPGFEENYKIVSAALGRST